MTYRVRCKRRARDNGNWLYSCNQNHSYAPPRRAWAAVSRKDAERRKAWLWPKLTPYGRWVLYGEPMA